MVISGAAGRKLDRPAAERLVVAALAGFSRQPVVLPVRSDPTVVSAAQLTAAATRVRTALSGPVGMRWRGVHWTIAPHQLRLMLALPGHGATTLRIGGPGADRYFDRLARALDRPARNAGFAPSSGGEVGIIRVPPPRPLAGDEVLIEVRAAGVGNWDEIARTGGWDVSRGGCDTSGP